ncbi:MAG: GNAT family N-acetyltransferase [Coriobacteriales bacterium]|nr:GNAT family N-acetyltransferase [Coriobacteriales bacterium]
MKIRALERSDKRAGFRCGVPSLDVFLEQYAWQNQSRHRLGVTYVAVDEPTRRVLGFITLVGGSIARDRLSRTQLTSPYPDVPVIRIARLAVDRRVQGVGLGTSLMYAALRIARDQARSVGCTGLLVDAKSEATEFYSRIGFFPLVALEGSSATRPRPVPMYLEIGSIEAALG